MLRCREMDYANRSDGRGAAGALRTAWCALLLVAVGACGDAPSTPVADGALAEVDADGIIYEMDDYMEAEGIRSGRIRADSAYVYNDSSVVQLYGMEMTLYHEDGRDRAEVTAERGTLHQRTEKMVARGDVVVQMAGTPERLETPELHYDPSSNRIWSDSATTRILPDGRTSTGTCFRSTLELTDVTICNPRGAVGAPPPPAGGSGSAGGPTGPGGDGG